MEAKWMKISQASKYAGISERTFWSWLKKGLKYSRLPSGRILIAQASIDEFLKGFEVDSNLTDKFCDTLLEKIK